MLKQITDEKSAHEALKEVVVGNILRITFGVGVGEKFQKTFLELRHKLEFDTGWLAVAHNRLALYGNWGDVSRVQDFTIIRMSPADCQIFAQILAEMAESIEVV